jgi:uncharacterized protein YqeY
MSIEKQLMEDMKRAMKSGDKVELATIRLLRAQIKTAAIDKMHELSDSEVIQVLNKEAKRRKEAIALFRQGNREDLVKKETAELEIISKYLPEQMSEADLAEVIGETITELQAVSEKDLGRVMSAVMAKVKGKADGKMIQQKVKEILANL